MTYPNLQDIRDKRTRDLLRGLLDRNRSNQDNHSTLSRLLTHVRHSDLIAFDDLLRNNKLFQHIDVLPEFPQSAPFQGKRSPSLVPSSSLALNYIAHRIAQNDTRLCEAFHRIKILNHAIHAGADETIVASINEIIKNFGHSLTLARKAAFIIGYAPKESLSHRASVDLVGAYGVNGKNYGMMATIDTIGSDFNYLDLKFRFNDYTSLERNSSISRKIAHLSFNPVAASENNLIELISSSYEISLLDASIALLSHIDQGIVTIDLPISIVEAWRALTIRPEGSFDYFKKKGQFLDLWAFRAAPAFVEYAAFRRIRYALESLYDLPDTGGIRSSLSQYTTTFFEGINRVSDVIPPEDHIVIAVPEKFDRETAGALSRSCALVWACQKDPDFSDITMEGMARLMGETFEIDRLIPTNTLRRAVATASNPFVKLILQTLLRAHSSATRDNFNFKDQFQRYVREYHDSDILDFMERVRSLDKKIIHYFVNLLDETMLSQMAFLMVSSEAIYETRARLLEWFSDIVDDDVTRDKAKQLRLDRKIAAVRGAINETRLNIDSVRFRQWVEQNKLTDFSDFIRQPSPNLPSIMDLTDASKAPTRFLAAHREPSKLALLALVQCYEEFCRNSDYGIASFLGRRIRHGTLRGTLLNGLPDPDTVDLPHPSVSQYQAWTREFSNSIDLLASRLYFKSKSARKDGLLSAEIDGEQKWQLCLVCLNQIYSQAQQDHGVLSVPLLIEQFCWLVFETELSKVQSFIGEARSRWGTLRLRYSPNDETTVAFEKVTNITLSDRFNTVISWFRKPPNISPVAELSHVIQVVLQEARDEYATFSPEIDFTGETDLQLSGATYYFVYDALTIAVRNAAKHGQHPGMIDIHAAVIDVGTAAKILEISVISHLRAGDDAKTALLRMEEAGQAGAAEADVIEGLSGIRKLKKMELERSILSFDSHAVPGCTDKLRISIAIPFKGLVE